jgi:hypothetical protein
MEQNTRRDKGNQYEDKRFKFGNELQKKLSEITKAEQLGFDDILKIEAQYTSLGGNLNNLKTNSSVGETPTMAKLHATFNRLMAALTQSNNFLSAESLSSNTPVNNDNNLISKIATWSFNTGLDTQEKHEATHILKELQGAIKEANKQNLTREQKINQVTHVLSSNTTEATLIAAAVIKERDEIRKGTFRVKTPELTVLPDSAQEQYQTDLDELNNNTDLVIINEAADQGEIDLNTLNNPEPIEVIQAIKESTNKNQESENNNLNDLKNLATGIASKSEPQITNLIYEGPNKIFQIGLDTDGNLIALARDSDPYLTQIGQYDDRKLEILGIKDGKLTLQHYPTKVYTIDMTRIADFKNKGEKLFVPIQTIEYQSTSVESSKTNPSATFESAPVANPIINPKKQLDTDNEVQTQSQPEPIQEPNQTDSIEPNTATEVQAVDVVLDLEGDDLLSQMTSMTGKLDNQTEIIKPLLPNKPMDSETLKELNQLKFKELLLSNNLLKDKLISGIYTNSKGIVEVKYISNNLVEKTITPELSEDEIELIKTVIEDQSYTKMLTNIVVIAKKLKAIELANANGQKVQTMMNPKNYDIYLQSTDANNKVKFPAINLEMEEKQALVKFTDIYAGKLANNKNNFTFQKIMNQLMSNLADNNGNEIYPVAILPVKPPVKQTSKTVEMPKPKNPKEQTNEEISQEIPVEIVNELSQTEQVTEAVEPTKVAITNEEQVTIPEVANNEISLEQKETKESKIERLEDEIDEACDELLASLNALKFDIIGLGAFALNKDGQVEVNDKPIVVVMKKKKVSSITIGNKIVSNIRDKKFLNSYNQFIRASKELDKLEESE